MITSLAWQNITNKILKYHLTSIILKSEKFILDIVKVKVVNFHFFKQIITLKFQPMNIN